MQYVVQNPDRVIVFTGTAAECGEYTRDHQGSFTVRPLSEMEQGAYGILAVDPKTPGAMVCGLCGRAWAEDITPAGRCPWEYEHKSVHDDDEPFDEATIESLHEQARAYARLKMQDTSSLLAVVGRARASVLNAIADAWFDGATR